MKSLRAKVENVPVTFLPKHLFLHLLFVLRTSVFRRGIQKVSYFFFFQPIYKSIKKFPKHWGGVWGSKLSFLPNKKQ